jgi:TRAP-type transport system periplasmic protein
MADTTGRISRREFISRTIIGGASVAVGGATLFGSGPRLARAASSGKKIALRLSHSWAPDPAMAGGHIIALRLQELVARKTNGELEIQIFPASQLGEERVAVEGVRMGTIDLMASGTAIWGNFAPKLAVCDLPYIFTSFAQAQKVLAGPAGAELSKHLTETTGARLLGLWSSLGFRNVATKSKEVKKVEDLKGLKIRVIQTPTYIRTFELLGASPTPMPFGEVYTSLQTGVLDGWEHDAPTMASAKMYEVTKFLARTEHLYGVNMLTANGKKVESLPAELRKALEEAGREACNYTFELAKQKEEEGLKLLGEKGMTITTFEKGPATERVKGYWKEYAEKVKASDILAKLVG